MATKKTKTAKKRPIKSKTVSQSSTAKSTPPTDSATSQAPAPRQLRRSTTDAILGGVCAGIAEYIEIDPVLVRLAFIALTFAGGAGIFLYIALWVIIPEVDSHEILTEESIRKNAEDVREKAEEVVSSLKKGSNDNQARFIFGVLLLFLGGYFLLSNFGILGWLDFGDIWPIILIAIGLALVIKRK